MKILVANLGSTSFKYKVFDMPGGDVLAHGGMDRIGDAQEGSRHKYRLGDAEEVEQPCRLPDHAAAIDEAHKHGIKVTAHLCSVTFREAVALGIDNLEHGLVANTDYVDGKQPDLCPEEALRYSAQVDLDMSSEEVQTTFREMIDAGVSMTSTMAINEMYVPGRPPVEQRSARPERVVTGNERSVDGRDSS